MSSASDPQLELLRAKLALAIGPLDVNLAYHEVKAARPNALNEPWSTDMSGPHKCVVFNNKTFMLYEVADAQLASSMARGCPPIDAGENIKLYLNDVWQLDIFHMMGFDMAAIRDPVTGADPVGSLYHSLIKSVDKDILKKDLHEDDDKGNENSATREIFYGDNWDEWDEVEPNEGKEDDLVNGHGQEKQDDDEANRGKDSLEDKDHGHADTVMEG